MRDTAGPVPPVVWLTGLSGSGKTTLGMGLVAALRDRGLTSILIDGDDLRAGLCRDLDFSREGRRENVRRAACLAALLHRQGVWPVVALIAPYRADRDLGRALVAPARYHEIHVAAPLTVCRARDPKGLYAAEVRGTAPLTGLGDPYEPSENPDLIIATDRCSPAEGIAQAITSLGM